MYYIYLLLFYFPMLSISSIAGIYVMYRTVQRKISTTVSLAQLYKQFNETSIYHDNTTKIAYNVVLAPTNIYIGGKISFETQKADPLKTVNSTGSVALSVISCYAA